ncbi:MAG: DUF423 domain-containing protein [Burkholderiales bacterium]|nr:DUF423 domain-containing protein [Bacteroidia bacterium]
MKDKKLMVIGLLGAIAVALGALGAHFLKGKLSTGLITTDQLNGFDTAVKYQMYHVLAMLALFLFSKYNSHKYIIWAYNSFIIGIVFFSGSLYFLCTRNLLGAEWLKALGPITPIGGLFFIAGWIFIALTALKKSKE